VNLQGSINVAEACLQNMVKKVVAISTDKVVHPVNTYGATKYLMEKVFQEYAVMQDTTSYNLVRYGNVLGSTGSVIQVWREMEKAGKVYATDPDMSRFWLTVDNAVDIILMALEDPIQSGTVVIPMCKSTTMKSLAEYTLNSEPEYTGIRPGEKRYEELLGAEESLYAQKSKVDDWIFLHPTTVPTSIEKEWWYDSEDCPQFTQEEIRNMIGE
jgi:UDP-N-acetylglucosamine 4,6-dehydratase